MIVYNGIDKTGKKYTDTIECCDMSKLEDRLGKVYYTFLHYFNNIPVSEQSVNALEFDVVNEDTHTFMGHLIIYLFTC